ncbi:MAG TPA: hypothetical protein VFE94_03455 [Candidatus Paceibacterota bacterium]|nr:hypothetical protein [Candidatus Paceibacterota bacterium]
MTDNSRLKEQIEKIELLKNAERWGSKYSLWEKTTERILQDSLHEDALKLFKQQGTSFLKEDPEDSQKQYLQELDNRKQILEGLLAEAKEYRQNSIYPKAKFVIAKIPPKSLLKKAILASIVFIVILIFVAYIFILTGELPDRINLGVFEYDLSFQTKESPKITYTPQVYFYDIEGVVIPKKSSGLQGGNLNDFSKISIGLTTELISNSPVKITYIDFQISASNSDQTSPDSKWVKIDDKDFVLQAGEQKTAMIVEIASKFLSELPTKHFPDSKQISVSLLTRLRLSNPETDEELARKQIQVICRNGTNLLLANHEEADFSVFYPSCLVMNIKDF